MFENIIGQPATDLIKHDIKSGSLPSSILFYGPEASGKGTTALELARVLSCEEGGRWNCQCRSCVRHYALSHPDVLVFGPRAFRSEIAACKAVFLSAPDSATGRVLFLRAARKLLLRFSRVIAEGDAKISKLVKQIQTVEDSLEDLASAPRVKLEKLCDKITAACNELESEGVAPLIPVSHIRQGSYRLRMAPSGKRKVMIIENADKMNDAARNSLLKILEEPPDTATIILCTTRPKALLPTVLSRVRPYNFSARAQEAEARVLERVFKTDAARFFVSGKSSIVCFLNGFLSVSSESLKPAAEDFLSSLFMPKPDVSSAVDGVMKASAKFEPRSLFPLFIEQLYNALSVALAGANTQAAVTRRELVRKYAEQARTAVEIYNQTPVLAIERLASGIASA